MTQLEAITQALLLTYVATLGFYYPFSPLPGSGQWCDLLAPALALTLLASRAARFTPALGLAAAYFAWAALSAAVNGGGWWKVAGLAELVAVFATAQTLGRDAEARDRILRVWCGAAAVLSVLGFLGSALWLAGLQTPLGNTGGMLGWPIRPKGPCITSNMLASIGLVPFIVLASEEGARLFAPYLRRALLVVLGLMLALSVSRTLLAVAVAFVFLKSRRRAPALVATLVCAALAYFSVRYNWGRAGLGLESPFSHPELGFRARIALGSLKTALAHPLFGAGPGAPAAWVGGYPLPTDAPIPRAAHFTPGGLAATLGFPGLVLFSIFVGWVARASARLPREGVARVLLIALGAMLFDGLTLDVQNLRHFWLLLGLVAI